ncbi:phosphoenolpyruvate carboxylase [Natrinema sp. 74]|uniref:phosphoenolpyruvate carboxylase n=1 Tax=Natrinema sp. 74 TaxID=3384159 RepID=UPI0038D40341
MAAHKREIQQDIRELGELLGEVLKEQASQQAFERVESCRRTAIEYRSGERDSRDSLVADLEGLSPHHQRVVSRAFTTYFELINLAEERERVRTIRTDSHEGTLADSLETAADELGEADVETVQRILDDVLIEPTFTAHPTEARRKTVKAKLRDISTSLETLDERLLTEKEEEQVWRDIDAEVTSLWQTPQVRNRQPEPEDEARNVQWYLENTLFDVVGEVYDELDDAIDAEVPADIEIPKLFEFRSWAGSDRDGNPYVTPEVTATTLERQRSVILEKYREQLKRLSGVLSQDGSRIDPGSAFQAALERDRERLPGSARTAQERYPDEPYRQKLKLMRERLDRVGDVRPGGYDDVDELLSDLEGIAHSLRDNGAESVVEGHVDPIRRQVATFGFSLASLDLRDHQQKHTDAIAEALERAGIDYTSLSEDERVELLTDAVLQDQPVIDLAETDDLSEDSARVLELFDSLADWQTEYGVEAIDTYAISMTEEPSHVLEVLFLADQAGVVSLPEHSGIDIVPLLETEYALSGARRIMGTLFENEAYSQALEARGQTQEIMLGYSDSNKENGFLAANWSLYKNQRRLGEICDDHDVTMRLFHGRGGSISRGGGPMNEALLALPNSTVTGQVKFTEQGEAIAEKYGNPRIAERNIEQMLNAQLRARKQAIDQPEEAVREEWLEAMEQMADAARQEYRDLLESEGFVRYFEQATPITVIEDLNLGSRPASRSGERTVEDLRAIPWVFSWTQSRCILPGWYALAAGIDAYLEGEEPRSSESSSGNETREDGGSIEMLQEMYDKWPFFRTTLDNAALSLSRTDLEIAEQYANIADPDLRDRFFQRITAEYERALELITEVGQRDELHARDWLGENLEHRNPYVDPLNVLQVHLLEQAHRTDIEERTLRLTVKGIAAGMKNTG